MPEAVDEDVSAVGDGLADESDGDLDVAEDVLVGEVGDVEVEVGDARQEGAHLEERSHMTYTQWVGYFKSR